MKLIDLLNKIANGEEVPKKIKIDNRFYYEYDENIDYKSKDGTYLFDNYIQINKEDMNMEVEILEEPRDIEVCGSLFTKSEYDKLAQSGEEKKIPEKLTDILRVDDLIPPVDENMYKIWTQTIKNHNKINDIIDYLKSKGE